MRDTWFLLGSAYGCKAVYLARWVSQDACGVVVRFPRNPDPTFIPWNTFHKHFRREVEPPGCLVGC